MAIEIGPVSYAVTGPIAEFAGLGRMLAFAAAYSTVSGVVVLATPAMTSVRLRDAESEIARRGGRQQAPAIPVWRAFTAARALNITGGNCGA